MRTRLPSLISLTPAWPASWRKRAHVAAVTFGTASGGGGGTAPSITEYSPAAGKAAGGDAVLVTGHNFAVGMTSTLGAVSAITPTSCTITTNAHAAGVFNFTLTTGGGTSPPNAFTYLAPPVVASIAPNHGPATLSNTGRLITCSGLPAPGAGVTVAVTVGGNAATSITNNGDGTLTVDFPAHAAGLATVVVTVDGVASTGGTNLYTFDPLPTLQDWDYVDTAGGSSFALGTGLFAGATISVNIGGGVSLTNVVVTGSTAVTATLPTSGGPYTPGSSYVATLTNPDGQSCTSTFVVFSPETFLPGNLAFDDDAMVGVTAPGGIVSTVIDQSANAYQFDGSGSLQLVANAWLTWSAFVPTGTGSRLTSHTNVVWGSKSATIFLVAKFPSSTADGAAFFESANLAKTANVSAFGLHYKTAGPQLDIFSGSSGNTTLNETNAVLGASSASGFRVYAFVFDRAATFPVTILGGVPVYERAYDGGAATGQNLITDQSSASNYDTALFSFFAANNGGTTTLGSPMQLLRAFAYNVALTPTQIQNVIQAMSSRYQTDPTPNTRQVQILGDSISSISSTLGTKTYSTYIYATDFYDNAQMDIGPSTSGWTASNAYTNRVALASARRGNKPYFVIHWLGTNDLATNDNLTPGDLWANTISLHLTYLAGLTAPALAAPTLAIPPLPRGNVASGTPASFEARRSGRDMSNAVLPGYANGHAYTVTTDFILVANAGTNFLFRCTTGGTSSLATPAWNFTTGATTSAGSGVVFTCYGRPLRDYYTDAALQASIGFALPSPDFTDPATSLLGNPVNVSNVTDYPDGIHPSQPLQTGQGGDGSTPTGPPASNSILFAIDTSMGQGGTWDPTYLNSSIQSVSPAVGYKGGGVALTFTGLNFGKPAASHPITMGGVDCTSPTRLTDVGLTATSPSVARGAQTITYTRTDGNQATIAWTAVDARFDSITPNSGSIDGGAGVYTILGAGFTNGIASITIGGVTQTISVVDDNTVHIPSLAASGAVSGASGSDIVITMTSGDVITGAGKFFYLPAGISRQAGGGGPETVSAISDYSGHGVDFVQSTAARQGAILFDATFGLNVLQSTVAGQTCYTTGGTGGGGYSMPTTNSSWVLIGRFWNGQPTVTQALYQNPAGALGIAYESSNTYNYYVGAVINGTTVGTTNFPAMLIGVNGTTTSDLYVNGTQYHSAAAPTASLGTPALGSANGITARNPTGGFNSPDFNYAEIIEFNARALTPTDLTTLNNYRVWKYGF